MLVLRLAAAAAVAVAVAVTVVGSADLAGYGCIGLGWGGQGVSPPLAALPEVFPVVGYDLGSGSGQAVVFVGHAQAGVDLLPLFVVSPAVLSGFSVVLAV